MKWLKIIAALVVGLYAISYFAFPTYTHRFRLTFQVEVDGQVKEGSSVITVSDTDNGLFPIGYDRWHRVVRGPSPWIDLGERGILLAAIEPHFVSTYEPQPYWAGSLSFVAYFGATHKSPGLVEKNVKSIRNQRGMRKLKENQLPEFIWLPNPLDRLSARQVPPSELTQLLGARLVSVSVEICDETADASLYEKLPWLRELEEQERSGLARKPSPFVLHAKNLLGDW